MLPAMKAEVNDGNTSRRESDSPGRIVPEIRTLRLVVWLLLCALIAAGQALPGHVHGGLLLVAGESGEVLRAPLPSAAARALVHDVATCPACRSPRESHGSGDVAGPPAVATPALLAARPRSSTLLQVVRAGDPATQPSAPRAPPSRSDFLPA